MSASGSQSRTAVWRKVLGVVQESLDGISAAGKNWRASSLRTILPNRQLVEETHTPDTIMPTQKRPREGLTESNSPIQQASQIENPGTMHALIRADVVGTAPLPQITQKIVQHMQHIAGNRKKTRLCQRREQKLDLTCEMRRERVLQLEEAFDQLATSVDADSTTLMDIESQLEKCRAAYGESDDNLRLLRGELMAYENNAERAVSRLEGVLAQFLSESGLLNDEASDTEDSEHENIRWTKRARTDSGSVENPPSPDPDAMKKREAVMLLREKRSLVQGIEADFENRSELYKDGLERWQDLLAAGDAEMTRTELDVQWCRNYGNLGLDLWEAEIARSEAAVEVMRLNALPISYSQTSKFADDPEDAAGLEHEAERAMATLDARKIEDWLCGIEEHSPIDQPAEREADDWEIQSLQFGESCSGIADGWIKIRLQRWDMIRERLWNDKKSGMDGDSAFPGGNFVIEVEPATLQGVTAVSETASISELQG